MYGTYRDILKWGDKREEKIDARMLDLVRERLHIIIPEGAEKYLPGNDDVRLEKRPSLSKRHLEYFTAVSGAENIFTDDFTRARFSAGKFYGELLDLRMGIVSSPPDVVISPRDSSEVEKIISYCNENRIAVVPSGGRSSVTGALEPVNGGVALDLAGHLNSITCINELNMTVTAGAGISGPDLEAALNSRGYTCGHFPQSFEYSSLGGWIAAKGAGQYSTGYGKIEDMVVSLKVVTPAGTLETREYPRTAQGWDVFRLFIGSEGTLGVITEATMIIRRYVPGTTAHASYIFSSFEDSVTAMREVMQGGYGRPHMFRISDPEETEVAFATSGFSDTLADRMLKMLGYMPGRRVLMFIAVEGDSSYSRFLLKRIKRAFRKKRCMTTGSKPVKKWLDQRYSSAYLRDPLMDLGVMSDTLETAVTWENLTGVWSAARAYAHGRPNTVMMIHISHVYENGANLYFTFLSPMKKGDERDDFRKFHSGLVETIIRNGGSLSHHHGVGRVLAPWMEEHLGRETMAVLGAVKRHFDPNNIMNPGFTLGLK